ncbi:unnamed protein product [Pleuronectes platessa]|uniref:Uncharacterized protein n=1 Tax=Pleuronectes platessa TaxID=8262 RepID=A0A9N7Z718_PLEPL|nr:unnamed protein product [Pleuronectes platessa]
MRPSIPEQQRLQQVDSLLSNLSQDSSSIAALLLGNNGKARTSGRRRSWKNSKDQTGSFEFGLHGLTWPKRGSSSVGQVDEARDEFRMLNVRLPSPWKQLNGHGRDKETLTPEQWKPRDAGSKPTGLSECQLVISWLNEGRNSSGYPFESSSSRSVCLCLRLAPVCGFISEGLQSTWLLSQWERRTETEERQKGVEKSRPHFLPPSLSCRVQAINTR